MQQNKYIKMESNIFWREDMLKKCFNLIVITLVLLTMSSQLQAEQSNNQD